MTGRRGGTVVLLVSVALVLAFALPAVAVTTTTTPRQGQISDQLRSLRQQVAEASAEESDALGRLDDAIARKRQLDRRIADLDGQLTQAQADFDAAASQLADDDASLADAEYRFQLAAGDLTDAKNELQSRAINAYMHGPNARVIAVLFRARTVHQLTSTYGYVASLVRQQASAVDRVGSVRNDLDRLREIVAAARDQSAVQQADLARRRDDLQSARQAQAAARTEAQADAAEQQKLLADIRSHLKEYEAQIAALKRESNSIAAMLRARQSGQVPLPSGKGILAIPIPGAPITSGFGPRMHPILHVVRMHTGIDFGAGMGTPIRAAADGTVVRAGDCGGYGNCTIIDHGRALATLYGHQSALFVSTGAFVKRGQVIGAVGSTGFSTGPHLHFEVRVSGTPVDPMSYL